MTIKNPQPLFDLATHYQIEVQGRLDVAWLQSFIRSVEIIVDDARQMEDITMLNVRTDQAGIVGLVRQLHGMGVVIRQLQIISSNA